MAPTPNPAYDEYQELKDLFDADLRAHIEGAKMLATLPEDGDFESAYQGAQNAMIAFVRTRERLKLHVAKHR